MNSHPKTKRSDKFFWILMIAFLGFIGGFYLLCTQYWGKSPIIETTTSAGIKVTYIHHQFSAPSNPKLGVLKTLDPESKIELTINVQSVLYKDSSWVNGIVDSAYSMLFSDYADSINFLLPDKFRVVEVLAPQWYWDEREREHNKHVSTALKE